MLAVIGGSGFIGTRLAKRLKAEGVQFFIVDKRISTEFPDLTRVADVTDATSLIPALIGASAIINLAAEHRDDVRPLSRYQDVNVRGAENICAAARRIGVQKIVFTSSVAIYGFAPEGTDESGKIAPFNEYGRTKALAERVFAQWQQEAVAARTLVVIRPTVVFGEGNRGNVYNLLKQISSGRFLMVGSGKNRKSMAYVENVASFIEHMLQMPCGVHAFNYVDKPDFVMNDLVARVRVLTGHGANVGLRIPYMAGFLAAKLFDLVAGLTGHSFTISSVRVKKFCSNSVYGTSIGETTFVPPVDLLVALERTVRYEFIEDNSNKTTFLTE